MMKKKCHFIGIGGIGMSGLAYIMRNQSHEISGSDLCSSCVTERLAKNGAKVFIGHAAQNITADMTVIYNSDIKKDNPEYQQALKLECPMLHRSDLLLQLMSPYKTLAVTGTHGKTTTSALLTSVLVEAGLDPTFAVGGILRQCDSNAGYGKGEYFVAEADESDGTFTKYSPFGSIVTNLHLDHMNHFGSEAFLMQCFKEFMAKVTSASHLFWCGDDSRLVQLMPNGISYGFGEECLLRAVNFEQKGWKSIFDVYYEGNCYPQVEVALIGKHNVLNALAVFGLTLALGIKEDVIRNALRTFAGVKRRCEKKNSVQEILLIDDYAHHPNELFTTLNAIRTAIGERRLLAIFQPHRYTRTQDCLGTYAKVFEAADELLVTDIYGAGEDPIPGISHEQIVQEISQNAHPHCHYVPRGALLTHLAMLLRPHDVVVTFGAGDVTTLGTELHAHLVHKPATKLQVGIVFGGRSSEHDISLLSAKSICYSLREDLYQLQYFGITKQGKWLSGLHAMQQLEFLSKKKEMANGETLSPTILEKLLKCDVLFPVLHGSYGEDGTIQGLFAMLDKAYVGCDHRAAAVCMDKALTKNVMIANGIATSPFITFSQYEWKETWPAICLKIEQTLTFPLFVKPVHLGSSIGVYKVSDPSALEMAIEKALCVDDRLVVENGICGREIEFALLGNASCQTFPPGEIRTEGRFYDYAAKYGVDGMQSISKAELSQELIENGMLLAKKAYAAAGCTGLARVDFFLDGEDKFWLNEINPMPGFTAISLYPQICAANGLPIAALLDRLLILALQRKRLQTMATM